MEWYLKVLRQYADFSGRARRKEYWMFVLFHILIIFGLTIFSELLPYSMRNMMGIGLAIYYLGTIIPYLAVTVRRLHDTGRSGWMILVSLIPIIGGFWMLYLTVLDGDHGENYYGPDPKGFDEEELLDEIGNREEPW